MDQLHEASEIQVRESGICGSRNACNACSAMMFSVARNDCNDCNAA